MKFKPGDILITNYGGSVSYINKITSVDSYGVDFIELGLIINNMGTLHANPIICQKDDFVCTYSRLMTQEEMMEWL